jgi:hypothetical protein
MDILIIVCSDSVEIQAHGAVLCLASPAVLAPMVAMQERGERRIMCEDCKPEHWQFIIDVLDPAKSLPLPEALNWVSELCG